MAKHELMVCVDIVPDFNSSESRLLDRIARRVMERHPKRGGISWTDQQGLGKSCLKGGESTVLRRVAASILGPSGISDNRYTIDGLSPGVLNVNVWTTHQGLEQIARHPSIRIKYQIPI